MDASFETLKPCLRVSLPMELILTCILPKLPAKSLLRFKCVSKSFLTEISSHKFNASFSEANRFFILPSSKHNTVCIFELDSPNSPPTICPYPIPSNRYATLLACCQSYLLITCSNGDSRPDTLILLNPITRIYRILPTVHIPKFSNLQICYGMCPCLDDEFNDDVKIVRFVLYGGPHGYHVRGVNIYHLRTNLWRNIESETMTGQWIDDPVLVQNHLLVMIFYDDVDRMTRIGCFDIKAERWANDVLLPDTISGEISSNSIRDGNYFYLGVLDGKLLFSCYDKNKATYTVWILKDYGVKSSWFKLMSLPAQWMKEVYYPIAYRKGSSHELLCISKYPGGKCYWYCLREKRFTKTEFNINVVHDYLSFAYIFKGSLSNLPGGQPIRSSSNEQEVDRMTTTPIMMDWA